MSKQVHCPECQSENTPGSKFCNSCGARLPKSTSVLCPRCQNPNPHTNFYCDNCGGRLHAEQSPLPEEEPKQEASDLPTSAKMFTLPTRDPGDTGDLDPASLPEWLKNQGEGSETGEGIGKLPRLSDLTPGKRNTAEDLPGWLISTENEDLLIDSPEDITTEHFLHLIQDINEDERKKLSGILSDPTIMGEAANLPDWLKNVAQPKPDETPAIPTKEPQVESGDSIDEDSIDWLFESPTTEDDSSQFAAKATLAQEETNPEDSDELPDWLGELGPPRTALLGRLDEDDSPSFESEIDESKDLPDWLTGETDSQSPAVKTQDTNDIFSEAYSFEDDVPDWMSGDEQFEDTPEDNAPIQEEALGDLTLDAAASTSLTGWLAEFDTDDGDVEETAVSPKEAPAADNVGTRRSLTDWLTAFDEEDLDPAHEPSDQIQPEDSEEPLPGWLTGVDEAVSAAAIVGKSTDDAVPAEDDSFDWLSDFDEVAEDAPGVDTAAEIEDDLTDVLDLDISTDNSLAAGNTGLLPDWLDDLEPATETSSQYDSDELGDSLDDLFGALPKDATGELKWLEEIGEDEIESEPDSMDSSLAPLVGAMGAAALIGASNQDDDATLDDNPDWLSEFADFDLSESVEEGVSETAVSELFSELGTEDEDDFNIEAIFGTTESTELDEFDIDDALLGVDEQTAGDWADIDGILSGTADSEPLPDWLAQLDDMPEIAVIEGDEEPPDEIPAWVANMRPGDTGELASVLPSALFTESDTSDLLGDPSDLADADLPDWLDATIDGSTSTADKGLSNWFDAEGMEDAPAELEALLADLPPSQAPEDMLQKAEIPAWLEELKPRELTGEPLPLTESRLESSGPLVGMPNTIAVEPIIAMPRVASTPSLYTVSPGQAQQALLLRQLVQEDPQPPEAGTAILSARGVVGLRILVAILLLVTVILGLYGPAVFKSKMPTTVPVPAVALNTAVSNAAGKTVLVAFEYTPALAGELSHEAEMLLAQLDANGSPILTTSQYVAGTAVSDAITAPYDVIPLGLIPGEAIGLRQLGSCLGEDALAAPCTSLHTRTLSNEMSNTLADVGLIIVLTGERNSLVNWVEQVGASSTVPIVIGATQALEPVVVPYYASAQVVGYLNGLPATVAYQQAYMQLAESPAETQYGALSLVYLVTAVILLIGGLAFGFKKKKA